MSKKRRNKKSLHLTDKKHPMLAIIATGLGFLSIVLFFAFCILSGTQKGKAGLLIGLGGFICIIISGIGFLAAWASLHQENIRPIVSDDRIGCQRTFGCVLFCPVYLWNDPIKSIRKECELFG